MSVVGTAYINVVPSLKGFQTKTEAELKGMNLEKDVKLKPKVDKAAEAKALAEVKALEKELADVREKESGATGRVVRGEVLLRELREKEAAQTAKLTQLTKELDKEKAKLSHTYTEQQDKLERIAAKTDELRLATEKQKATTAAIERAENVRASSMSRLNGFTAEAENLETRLSDARKKSTEEIKRLTKEHKPLEDRLESLGNKLEKAEKKVDKFSGTVGSAARSAGLLTTKFYGLGATVPIVASLGIALTQTGEALAILPAAAVAAGGAYVTLKLGFENFAKALKTPTTKGELKAQQQAFESLAPAAKAAAKEIDGLKDEFHAVQQAVQNNLFANMVGPIKELGQNWAPLLKREMGGFGTVFNKLGIQIAGFANSKATLMDMPIIFGQSRVAVYNLGSAIVPLLSAFRNLAIAGGSSFMDLTRYIAGAAGHFDAFIQKARETGKIQDWINTGKTAIIGLGHIFENVGSIIASVFRAANSVTSGFFGTIQALTGQVAAFLRQGEGQTMLVTVFRTIHDIVSALQPAIGTVLHTLSQTIQILAPVLPTVAASFARIVQAVAPLVPFLAQLAVAILPPIVALVASLGPALPIIAGGFLAVAAGVKAINLAVSVGEGLTSFASTLGKVGVKTDGLVSKLSTFGSKAIGPLSVVLGLATVALGIYAEKQQQAAQRAENHKTMVDSLSSALRESNGVIDENVRKTAAQDLQNKYNIDSFKKFGVTLGDLTDVALGLPGAYDKVNNALKAGTTYQEVYQGYGMGTQRVLSEQGTTAIGLGKDLNSLQAVYADSINRNKDLESATHGANRSMSDTSPNALKLKDDIQKLASNTGDAASKADILNDAMKRLNGVTEDTDTATAHFYGSIDSLKSQLESAQGPLLNNAGTFDLTSAKGRDAREAILGMRKNMADYTTAAQAAQMPQEQINQHLNEMRQSLIDTIAPLVGSKEKAAELVTQMGLVPTNLTTLVDTPGMSKATADVINLKNKVDAVPKGHTITTEAITAEAEANLRFLGYNVTHLPNGQVTIGADTRPALDGAQRMVATINGMEARITVRANGDESVQFGGPGGHIARLNALGGIVKMFASGGFNRLNPMSAGTAQVVPPNTWRVIGDRSKDDEAYIPINNSGRSQSILSATASRMGFALVKQLATGGLIGFASGGLARSGATAPSATAAGDGNVGPSAGALDDAAKAAQVFDNSLKSLSGTVDGKLAPSLKPLTEAAKSELPDAINGHTVPAMALLEDHAGVQSVQAIRKLGDTLPVLGGGMIDLSSTATNSWNAIASNIGVAGANVGQTQRTLQGVTDQSWHGMAQSTQDSTNRQLGTQEGLNRGLGGVRQAMQETSDWTRTQWLQMERFAGDPARWILQNPVNAGLVGAWNNLNSQFGLNKAVSPVPIPFARGGRVPGVDLGYDTVPAMLRPGEYVFPVDVVQRLGLDKVVGLHKWAQGGVQHFAQGGVVQGAGANPFGDIFGNAFDNSYQMLREIASRFPNNIVGADGQGMFTQAADRSKDALTTRVQQMVASLGALGGAGVQQWAPLVVQALAMVGQPLNLLPVVLRRMQQESGGNPVSLNDWDINWQQGHPSVGLMQMINKSYQDNADPRRNVGPYLYGVSVDPLSNILASFHYAINRYGSLPTAFNRPGGYDSGGWLPPGITPTVNLTGKPEAVLTNDQWKLVERNLNVGGGGQTFNTNVDARGTRSDPATIARETSRQIAFDLRKY